MLAFVFWLWLQCKWSETTSSLYKPRYPQKDEQKKYSFLPLNCFWWNFLCGDREIVHKIGVERDTCKIWRAAVGMMVRGWHAHVDLCMRWQSSRIFCRCEYHSCSHFFSFMQRKGTGKVLSHSAAAAVWSYLVGLRVNFCPTRAGCYIETKVPLNIYTKSLIHSVEKTELCIFLWP